MTIIQGLLLLGGFVLACAGFGSLIVGNIAKGARTHALGTVVMVAFFWSMFRSACSTAPAEASEPSPVVDSGGCCDAGPETRASVSAAKLEAKRDAGHHSSKQEAPQTRTVAQGRGSQVAFKGRWPRTSLHER